MKITFKQIISICFNIYLLLMFFLNFKYWINLHTIILFHKLLPYINILLLRFDFMEFINIIFNIYIIIIVVFLYFFYIIFYIFFIKIYITITLTYSNILSSSFCCCYFVYCSTVY